MSGLLSEVADFVGLGPELEALRNVLGLRSLKPGSFRGIPFHVDDTQLSTGRRVVVHEFPLRDSTQTEDMGRRGREISITAFVLGEDWQERRDLLLLALEDFDKPGTLVLPGGLEFPARASAVTVSESNEGGRMARFALTFFEAGEIDAAFKPKVDTATLLRRAIGRVLRLVRAAFALVYAVRNFGDFVRRAALSFLAGLGEQLAEAWLGLPGLDLERTARAIADLDAADPEDPSASVAGCAETLADAVDAAAPPPREADLANGSRGEDASPRQRAAEAMLAVALAPRQGGPARPGLLAGVADRNAAALDGLARDTATLGAARVLAGTEFASAAEALRVRDKLLSAIDARADWAASAELDELWRGWQELRAAAARDLAERARRAPRLTSYALPASLPSLALAQRLLRDASGADALVALNNAPHPAFMPAEGVILRG